MKNLLEYLVKAIVTQPGEVTIEEVNRESQVDLLIHAHSDDLKIIIGKNGRTIKSLREILKIKAILEKTRVNVQIAEA